MLCVERYSQASAAVGKDYAQRPASYKGSLSLQMDRFTHRKKSRCGGAWVEDYTGTAA